MIAYSEGFHILKATAVETNMYIYIKKKNLMLNNKK